jgi:hypothetical protein
VTVPDCLLVLRPPYKTLHLPPKPLLLLKFDPGSESAANQLLASCKAAVLNKGAFVCCSSKMRCAGVFLALLLSLSALSASSAESHKVSGCNLGGASVHGTK